jgi:hypothetical protein
MEWEGISTVVIGSGMFEERLKAMNLPRTILTQNPMGRPLGIPGDIKTQRKIILSALQMLAAAESPGQILVIPASRE